MFGGLNPKKMQAMMKQLGMNQEDISAEKVTIEKSDGGKIIIENPSVVKIAMQGQENFQISGDISEQNESPEVGISEEDVKMVMEKTGCAEGQARDALEKTGDLTDAILELSSEEKL